MENFTFYSPTYFVFGKEMCIRDSIKGAGTDIIRIRGVRKLHGTEYSIIPDQIEAGTFMCAAAITRGDIMVQNVICLLYTSRCV